VTSTGHDILTMTSSGDVNLFTDHDNTGTGKTADQSMIKTGNDQLVISFTRPEFIVTENPKSMF